MFFFQDCLTFNHCDVSFDGNNFTCFFINEILSPRFQNACSQLTTKNLLQIRLVCLHLFCKIEDTKDFLIRLVTNCTKECGYWQLLLTVDVSIHHVVDVGRKLNPRTLEWDDTS